MRLRIVNRSGWPAWFVKPVCRWICSRAKIKAQRYTIELPSYGNVDGFAGRAPPGKQRSRINRRIYVPYVTKYWRYEWSISFRLETRCEAFVYLIAHEAWHQNQRESGRLYKLTPESYEMECEKFARDTVKAIRENAALRAKLIAKVRKAAREYREKHGKAQRRVVPIVRDLKAAAIQPTAMAASVAEPKPKAGGIVAERAAKAAAMLAKWQRAERRAKNKVRKYLRQVRYYERRFP